MRLENVNFDQLFFFFFVSEYIIIDYIFYYIYLCRFYWVNVMFNIAMVHIKVQEYHIYIDI